MTPVEFGAFVGVSAAFLGWAVLMEIRFHSMQGQLVVAKQEKKDAEITAQNHALSDAALDDKLSKDFSGGTKPSA